MSIGLNLTDKVAFAYSFDKYLPFPSLSTRNFPAKFHATSVRTPFSLRYLYVGLALGPLTSAFVKTFAPSTPCVMVSVVDLVYLLITESTSGSSNPNLQCAKFGNNSVTSGLIEGTVKCFGLCLC